MHNHQSMGKAQRNENKWENLEFFSNRGNMQYASLAWGGRPWFS